jgi:hypothetical protein
MNNEYFGAVKTTHTELTILHTLMRVYYPYLLYLAHKRPSNLPVKTVPRNLELLIDFPCRLALSEARHSVVSSLCSLFCAVTCFVALSVARWSGC